MKKKCNKKVNKYAYGASEVINAAAGGLGSLLPYATSGQATVGTALGGMATGAAAGAALGPIGAGVGAGVGLLMGSIGTSGSVDEYTGEVTNPSGIAGLFGHSKSYLNRKSNRIKNSNISRSLTDAIRANYYNDASGYGTNTFAQGGTIEQPVEFMLSPGELYVSPKSHETHSPNANAEPNSKDNIKVTDGEGEGGWVFSNAKNRKDIDPKGKLTNAEYMKKIIKPNKKATDKYSQGTLDAQVLIEKIGIQKQEQAKLSENSTGKYDKGTGYVESMMDKYKRDFDFGLPEFQKVDVYADAPKKKSFWNSLSDTLPSFAQIAEPIISLSKNKSVQKPTPRLVSPVYSKTSVDNRPLLRQITGNSAISRYNARNLGNAGMSYALQDYINQNRQVADVYSDLYNKEIAASVQNAQIANRAQEYNAAAMHTADVEYAQNMAAAENLKSRSINQIGKIIAGTMRDKKLMNRDTGLWEYMLPMINYGSEVKSYNTLNKIFGYGS